MMLWGASAFLAVLVPKNLGRSLVRRFVRLGAAGVAVAVATTLAALPIEAAALGDGWPDAVDPGTVGAILFDTSVGRAWAAQALAAATLVAACVRPAGARLPAVAASTGLSLATLALTGHAAMHEGWLGVLHRLNDAAHVLAGGAWLGALLPLLPILRALDQPACRREAGTALRRFSIAGHAAVALVIATGALNTALTLGRWPTELSSPYQALLATKIALVATMAVLALVNRYVVVPRIPGRPGPSLGALRAVTAAEVGLGLAVIACVSTFGRLEPS